MWPVFEIGEQHHRSLHMGELRERCEKRLLAGSIVAGAIGCLVRGIRQRVSERLRAAAARRAQCIEGASLDDGHEPRLEAGWIAQRGQLLVRLNERCLRNIVGVERVEHNSKRARQRGAPMPAHQGRVRLRITGEGTPHMVFVWFFTGHIRYMTPESDVS